MQNADGETERPRPRHARRGLLAHGLRVVGLAGEAANAALDLVHAETRLARAAVPHGVGWFCVALVFGISLVACGWTALLYGLIAWIGSLGWALAVMASVSVVLFALAVAMLRRTLRWLGFVQTRRRLALLLDRKGERNDCAEPSS